MLEKKVNQNKRTRKEIKTKAKFDEKEIRKIVALIGKSKSWFFKNLTK